MGLGTKVKMVYYPSEVMRGEYCEKVFLLQYFHQDVKTIAL